MSAEIKIAADKFCSVASVAKKITGSILTVGPDGIIVSVEGLWMINSAAHSCSDSSASFTSDVPLAKLKKINGDITITECDSGYSLSGTDRSGVSVNETVEARSMDSIPEVNEENKVGKIDSSELVKLLSSKLTSSLPTYLMFSKESAISFVLNEFNAGLTKAAGEFEVPFAAGLSKNAVSKLYSILSKLKANILFDMSAFSCWDSTYIKLHSDLGMTLIIETANKHIPAYPSHLAPSPALFTVTAEELQSLLKVKPSYEDKTTITKGDYKVEVMSATLVPVFNVLDKTGVISVSTREHFVYLCDANNHVFVVGAAK